MLPLKICLGTLMLLHCFCVFMAEDKFVNLDTNLKQINDDLLLKNVTLVEEFKSNENQQAEMAESQGELQQTKEMEGNYQLSKEIF